MAQSADIAIQAPLSAEEVRRLCGDALAWKVEAILETGANAGDLQAALAWSQGDDNGRQLSGAAAEVYDILTADEAPDEEP
jgi:hypothetical protein